MKPRDKKDNQTTPLNILFTLYTVCTIFFIYQWLFKTHSNEFLMGNQAITVGISF